MANAVEYLWWDQGDKRSRCSCFYSGLWGACSQFIHSEAEIFGRADITWLHSAEWQEHDSCPGTSDFLEQ